MCHGLGYIFTILGISMGRFLSQTNANAPKLKNLMGRKIPFLQVSKYRESQNPEVCLAHTCATRNQESPRGRNLLLGILVSVPFGKFFFIYIKVIYNRYFSRKMNISLLLSHGRQINSKISHLDYQWTVGTRIKFIHLLKVHEEATQLNNLDLQNVYEFKCFWT